MSHFERFDRALGSGDTTLRRTIRLLLALKQLKDSIITLDALAGALFGSRTSAGRSSCRSFSRSVLRFWFFLIVFWARAAYASEALPQSSDNTVISPLGIVASLCGLKPGMSNDARHQISKSFNFECTSREPYLSTSVWLPSAWQVETATQSQVFDQAELHRGTGSFNVSINRWLANLQALPLPNDEPIIFASVNVIRYSGRWKFPGIRTTKPGIFHGLHHSTVVTFATNLRFAEVETFPECDRARIALADGSVVFITRNMSTPLLAKCFGEPMRAYRVIDSATVALPELQIAGTQHLRNYLEKAGIRSLFRASDNPFPGFQRDVALDEVDQSVMLRLDRYGIGVTATTISDYALSGGGLTAHHITFDMPFALRLEDASGNDLADAIVRDL